MAGVEMVPGNYIIMLSPGSYNISRFKVNSK